MGDHFTISTSILFYGAGVTNFQILTPGLGFREIYMRVYGQTEKTFLTDLSSVLHSGWICSAHFCLHWSIKSPQWEGLLLCLPMESSLNTFSKYRFYSSDLLSNSNTNTHLEEKEENSIQLFDGADWNIYLTTVLKSKSSVHLCVQAFPSPCFSPRRSFLLNVIVPTRRVISTWQLPSMVV